MFTGGIRYCCYDNQSSQYVLGWFAEKVNDNGTGRTGADYIVVSSICTA